MTGPGLNQDVIDLALEIADVSAQTAIECHCLQVPSTDGIKWWDIDSMEDDGAGRLREQLRYLDLRGLLRRHFDDPTLVTFPRAPDTAPITTGCTHQEASCPK